ncbi:MAG: glycosyltransferase [Syntrophaceae bacterium]
MADLISVIIPVYNQHEMTNECIKAVLDTTANCEIIVVDNGSVPPIDEAYFGQSSIIRNNTNLGFPAAVNQGIRAAKGDVVVLLNNDVIVTPRSLERLANWLNEYDIVGPMTNYCAGRQKVTIGAYTDINELNHRALEFTKERLGSSIGVKWVIGFCMVFKKSLYAELGELDESIWPCSGEDLDFCFRALAAGRGVGIAQDTYVHHFGSQTFEAMQGAGEVIFDEAMERGHAHLKERWGKDFCYQDLCWFTGERAMPLAPNMPKNIMREHWERYQSALSGIEGKRVLDVACGAGYGSRLLAEKALSVVGVDVSDEAIRYCRAQYRRENLEFRQCDACNLDFTEQSFDVAVSFETIEHLADDGAFLRGIARVLADDGTLIISTPLGGSSESNPNKYHVAFYQRDSFKALLERYFHFVACFYQRDGGFHTNSISPEYSSNYTGEYIVAVCKNPRKAVSNG